MIRSICVISMAISVEKVGGMDMKTKWLISGGLLALVILGWANRTTLAFLIVPLFLESNESALPSAAIRSNRVVTESAFKTYKNAVVPSQSQMKGFFQGDTKSPILMLNLLKFKDKALYEDGRPTTLSGKEAYDIYAKEVRSHLKKVGGEIILGGEISRLMLGQVEDLWDVAAVARYPSRAAMLEMMMDGDYRESEKHRSAGLEGQLNLEIKEFSGSFADE